jgi:galactokinase
VLASDLPRAAGMSSSSALVVGVAAALVRIAGIENRAEWRANIHQTLDAAGYYACLENGLTFGTLAGDAGVGTHGGSEDHAAILTGIAGHLSAFSFVPMRQIGGARVPDDWRFVLAPSGVRAEKTGAARDSYNQLARGTRALLEIWNTAGPHASSLGSALGTFEAVSIEPRDAGGDAAGRLRDLARRASIPGWPADTLVRRLDHFVREDARVAEALDAFRHGDAARLTRLSADSQADAEALLGNQVPETAALARSAADLGAFAASSFGAGFGGSVWALVGRTDAARFVSRWHPEAFVAPPGPGLTDLSK